MAMYKGDMRMALSRHVAWLERSVSFASFLYCSLDSKCLTVFDYVCPIDNNNPWGLRRSFARLQGQVRRSERET